jgi:hypothetical protein
VPGSLEKELREEDAIFSLLEDVIFSQYYTLAVGGLTLHVESESHLLYCKCTPPPVPGFLDKK